MTEKDCGPTDAGIAQWVESSDFMGPPKPWQCVDGYQSHEWLLGLDEGRPSLRTDCELCCSGMADWLADDDCLLQMDSMPVRLSIEHEPGNPPYGIDPYVWVDITPSTTENVECQCVLIDAGSYLSPPEWQQNPDCPVHPATPENVETSNER